MKRRHLQILLVLMLCSQTSFAQSLNLEFESQPKTLEDVWNLSLENLGQENLSVIVDIIIRQGNNPIYAAQSIPQNIMSGIYQWNKTILLPQVSINKLQNQNRLSQGLQIFYKIHSTTGKVLVEERSFVSVEEGMSSNDDRKLPLSIGFAGNAHIYGQVSDATGVSSFVPQNYLRAEVFPRVSVADIPIGLDVFLSTEQSAQRQNVNQISLYFDANDFNRSMRRKLDGKIKQLEAIGDPSQLGKLNEFKDKVMSKEFPDLKTWESQLKDEAIKKGLSQLKTLKSLESVLSNPDIDKTLSRLTKLKSARNLSPQDLLELEQLSAFQTEITKIKSKAEELKALTEKFKKYEDLQSKIDKAKKFKSKALASNPTDLRNGLKEFGLMSKAQEVIGGFKEVTIGTSFPYYSNLSLRSLSVNGLNVEWNPGKLYIATTIGKSAREVLNRDFTISQLTLPQSTIAAKLGYGSRYDNHLHLSYIRIADGTSDFVNELSRSSQENTMLGLDGQFTYKSINVGGEIFGSLFTGDRYLNPSADEGIADASIPLSSLFGGQNATSAYDIAWKAFTKIDLGKDLPRMNATIEKIGADYYSLGAPTLINDLLRWKIDFRQEMWNRQLSLSAFARRDENQLSPNFSSVVSSTQSFGLQAMLRVSNWPIINFTYAPYGQNNRLASTSTEQSTDQRLLNLTLMYPTKLSQNISSNTQIGFLNQDLSSTAANLAYSLTMYSLNQSFTLKRNTLNLGISYTPNQLINDATSKVWTFNLSGGFQMLDKWNHSIGFQRLAISDLENKNGFMWTSDYPINNQFSITTRIQRFIYSHGIDTFNDYSDFVAWGGVRVNW